MRRRYRPERNGPVGALGPLSMTASNLLSFADVSVANSAPTQYPGTHTLSESLLVLVLASGQ